VISPEKTGSQIENRRVAFYARQVKEKRSKKKLNDARMKPAKIRYFERILF
jgi:hypothetical protein